MSNPPPSSSGSPPKPASSGNLQVAIAPIQGIGWPSMNDAQPQNAILSGDEANIKPQLVQLVGDAQYKVDLQEEEDRGGHAIRDHVGKSNTYLKSQVGKIETPNATIVHMAEGSFYTEREAEDYTNKVLALHKDKIYEVVNAREKQTERIEWRFGEVTGKEAFAKSINDTITPFVRQTFSVAVIIQTAKHSPRGYIVRSAFPVNLGKEFEN